MQEGMWRARGVGAWVQVAVTCVEGTALVATGWAASEWAAKGPAKECRLSQRCKGSCDLAPGLARQQMSRGHAHLKHPKARAHASVLHPPP
jgi:hypothetical protein